VRTDDVQCGGHGDALKRYRKANMGSARAFHKSFPRQRLPRKV
jgi:hypothetical protein